MKDQGRSSWSELWDLLLRNDNAGVAVECLYREAVKK